MDFLNRPFLRQGSTTQILAAFCSAILSTLAIAGDFPQFRGPNGRGKVDEQSIPLEWSETKNLAWKAEGLGSGWSQPIVVGQRIFITSAIGDKALSPKSFADGVRTPQSMGLGFLSKSPDIEVSWQVCCLDLDSGRLLWKSEVDKGRPKFAIHPSNTYATETPAADASRVYAYFGATGRIAALNHDGQLLWQRDFGAQPTSNRFGTGSSLAIHDGLIFVQNFGEETADLICLSADTGETKWTQSRQKAATSWTSPIVWRNHLRVELIVSGGDRVSSYDPATGSLIWTVGNIKAATACSVAMDHDHIYFGGSDPFSSGPLFAVTAGGNGDLSPEKSNAEFPYCRWLAKKAAPGMASPVAAEGLVYVTDKNILRCYRASDGERLYQQRLPDIDMVNASPLVVGDKLLLVGESGVGCIVQVGEEFQVVGRGKLDDTIWATPAVASGRILIRGLDTLYCLKGKS